MRARRLWFTTKSIEYQVKLQIVSLSLQIAVFGETRVSTFLQIHNVDILILIDLS